MAAFATDPISFPELHRFLADQASKSPAIVERINPADASLSDPFRGVSPEANLREALSSLVAPSNLSTASWGKAAVARAITEGRELGEEAIRNELRQLTGGSGSMSDRELLRLLASVSSEERMRFIQSVLEHAEAHQGALRFLREKLNNALLSTSEAERAGLAVDAARRTPGVANTEFITELCRSARSFDELCTLVRCVGVARIVQSGSPALIETAATATLLQELQRVAAPFLKDPADKAPEQVKELQQMLLELRKQVIGHPEFKDTKRYQKLLEQLDSDTALLRRGTVSGRDAAEVTVFLETFRARISLELQYGILLRGQEAGVQPGIGLDDEPLPSHGVEWTLAQVRSVEATFRALPGVILYTTPMLHEIQRVETLGSPYVLGRRFEDGVVRIADSAINLRALEILYPGCSSLQVVLTHELGHSVQLGLYPSSFQFVPGEGIAFADGDPRYQFKEYLGLAGWRIFTPGQFQLTNGGLSVQIGEDEYPVGQPVNFNGQDVIFTLRGGLLLAYKALGPFSLVDYARTNPWEDFAEAFCEYTLRPDRLIVFAPEKFKFLDEEFGRYRDDQELHKKLKHQLERRKQNGSHKE